MIKKIILFVAIALTICSCENEDIDITVRHKATADIRAILNNVTRKNTIEIAVTKENSMEVNYRNGMSVSLYVNGQLTHSGITSGEGSSYRSGDFELTDCHFNVGDKVELFVDSDTLDIHASAQCVVDQPVVIKDFKRVFDERSSPLYYITINEPLDDGKDHFYRLSIYSQNTYFYPYDYYYDSNENSFNNIIWKRVDNNLYYLSSDFSFDNDIALNDGQSRVNMNLGDTVIKTYGTWMGGTENTYAIFSNKYFENGEYTLRINPELSNISYSIWNQKWNHLLVCVSRISDDEYYFLHASTLLSQYDGGKLFSGNPPSLNSNINGAKGIFAVESTSAVYDFWSCVSIEQVQQIFNADTIAAEKEVFLQNFNL
ncbi:MAG: DUF4249 domain-containing protein [Bacteroidales bacterium]|nr:DUF4249 domain-containing protein [Bacteroidales bacterium]